MNALKFSTVLALIILTEIGRADPLDTWTSRGPLRQGLSLAAIAYGNLQFVAVGYGGTIMTSSDDGVTWVQRESGTTNFLHGIGYGGGQFVAFGYGYTAGSVLGDTTILTSADGVSWSKRWSGKQTELHGIAYGKGQFVAVGITEFEPGWFRGAIVTSAEGINWVQRQSGPGLDSIAYGNGQFVAGSRGGTTLTSADGMNWPDQESVSGEFCQCWNWGLPIAYGNGHFVVLGSFAPTNVYYEISGSSADGLNWVKHQRLSENVPAGIAYGNGKFVAVGSDNTAWPLAGHATIQTSTDGWNWVLRQSSGTGSLRGVAFGNGHFVAVAFGGAILQSGSIINLEIRPNTATGLLSLSLEGPTGLDYTIQTSTDLISWQNLTNINSGQPRNVILDAPPAGSNHAFYRAHSQ